MHPPAWPLEPPGGYGASRCDDRRGKHSVAAVFETAFQSLEIIELDEAIATNAARLAPATLRSVDAIHLASAMILGDEVSAFVTYDLRLADAARLAGLTVVTPA
jgi:uncharacterized protein